jgi:HD-GYP domain-containing protein (c-di-GMP phosphodiesterase class II)
MYTDKLQQGKKARAEIVSSLLASLFERGNLAEGERDQVQELAIRLGQALKIPEDHLASLALFAQVYDLGKVGLPDSIIHSSMHSNTGELTEAEREALHRHPESGYRIASSSPELADVADLILKHHENYDGSGYPLGLKDDAIPIECRILSVAIAYSAMTNPRPYAKTLTPAQALAELQRCAGSQFDPAAVTTFVKMMA